MDSSLVYNSRELARALGIGRSHLEKLQSTGRLPRARRLGRKRIWPRDEVAAWLAAGAPSMDRWEAMQAGGTRRPARQR